MCACHGICKWTCTYTCVICMLNVCMSVHVTAYANECVYMYLCYMYVHMCCIYEVLHPYPLFRDVRHLNSYQLYTHGFIHAITCMWRRWRTTFRSWFSSPVVGLNSGPQGFIAEPPLTSCRDFKDWSIRSGGKRLSSLTTQSWVLVFLPFSLFQISPAPMCFPVY